MRHVLRRTGAAYPGRESRVWVRNRIRGDARREALRGRGRGHHSLAGAAIRCYDLTSRQRCRGLRLRQTLDSGHTICLFFSSVDVHIAAQGLLRGLIFARLHSIYGWIVELSQPYGLAHHSRRLWPSASSEA